MMNLVAAGALQGLDLVKHIVGVSGLQLADVDDHVDFVGAVGDGVLGLKLLAGRGVAAVRETDDGADGHFAVHIIVRPLDVAGWDANRGRAIGDGVVAQSLDVFPRGGLFQYGVVNHRADLLRIHVHLPPFFMYEMAIFHRLFRKYESAFRRGSNRLENPCIFAFSWNIAVFSETVHPDDAG